MYQRVLLAYDGSLEGAVALREGAILAKVCGASLFILSVVPDATGVGLAEGVHSGAMGQHMERYRELLERGVTRLKQMGFDPVARLAVGDPARAIGAFAREMRADLVVVGHHRRNMLERWWSGAAGAYISDHIDCTLLIARNVVSDEAFEAFVKGVARV
jgi:nucleotide-binding universal stress UspA family protein